MTFQIYPSIPTTRYLVPITLLGLFTSPTHALPRPNFQLFAREPRVIGSTSQLGNDDYDVSSITSNTPALVGIAVGCFALVLSIGLGIFFWRLSKAKQKAKDEQKQRETLIEASSRQTSYRYSNIDYQQYQHQEEEYRHYPENAWLGSELRQPEMSRSFDERRGDIPQASYLDPLPAYSLH